MVSTSFRFVIVLGLVCFLSSCSVDRCQIISHPSAAKPGDTISVLYSDLYLIISTTPTASKSYARDSLHVAYGLPSGWSVLSSDYYVASGIKLGQMTSIMSNPALLATIMQDSLAAYTQRKSPMTKDAGWASYFTGKTFTAHNTANNDSIPISGNGIGQWLAYSSKINLAVQSGTKMDTGVALSSLPIDSATLGTIKTLYGTDSIWVKAIPVVCFAQIIAGKATEIDTLLYFSKTGPKPSTGISIIPNYDKGDMTYVPISINPNNAVLLSPYGHNANALLRVSPSALTPGSRISMSIGSTAPWRLSIYTAQGKTVRSFATENGSGTNNPIMWDGTSSAGKMLQAGVYCVKLESAGKTASQTIRVMK
jgi:hypothetical protein